MSGSREEDALIGERLAEALAAVELSAVEAAPIAGTSPNTMRRWLKGEVAADAKALARLADRTGHSLNWILTGRGSGTEGGEDEMVRLPMLAATLAAGAGSFVDGAASQAEWQFPRAWLRRLFGHDDLLELLRVVGDSMEPELSEGDWAMVDRKRSDPRDGLYAVRLQDALLVKRVQFLGRTVRLVSANSAYPPIAIDREDEGVDLEIIAPVVWSSKVHVAT